ncbi:MAG: methyltransferase, partial [Bacteroidales bacterium]|nr:methyltransferase [Bacteroidales bacterium]
VEKALGIKFPDQMTTKKAKADFIKSLKSPSKQVEQAEAEVNTNPTEKQKEAGNYKKGHVKVLGIDIAIEQPKGSVRKGTDENGREWESEMKNTYGYFKRTKGKDGDQIDVFLGDNLESKKVFVVDQVNDKKELDEHKVMIGFNNAQEAEQAYLSNYEKGWQGLGAITETDLSTFKKWLGNGTRKQKAFADYNIVKKNKPAKPKKLSPFRKALNEALNKEPESLEEAVLMFIAEGGRFKTADFKRHSLQNKEGKELKTARLAFLRKDGLSMDIAHREIGLSENMVEEWDYSGAMDVTNVIMDILTSYVSRSEVQKELIKRKQDLSDIEYYGMPKDDYDRMMESMKDDDAEIYAKEEQEAIQAYVDLLENNLELFQQVKEWPDNIELSFDELTEEQVKILQSLPEMITFGDLSNNELINKFLTDEQQQQAEQRRNIQSSKENAEDREANAGVENPSISQTQRTDQAEVGQPKQAQSAGEYIEQLVRKSERKNRNESIFGVELTPIEVMEFDKWKSNNNIALNTLTPNERTKVVQDWKNNESKESKRATEKEPKSPLKAKKKSFKQKVKENLNEKESNELDDILKQLKSKLGNLNTGIDPETMLLANKAAYLVIKSGVRKFNDFAKTMVEMIGEGIKPHIKSLYEYAKNQPEFDSFYDELTDSKEVRKADIEQIISVDNLQSEENNSNLAKKSKDVESSPRNTEQSSESSGNPTDGSHVQPKSGASGNAGTSSVQQSTGQTKDVEKPSTRAPRKSSLSRNGDQSIILGTRSDEVSQGDLFSASTDIDGSTNSGASSTTSSQGTQAEPKGSKRSESVTDASKSKRRASKSSSSSIESQLPKLYPEQIDDVKKAESRFKTGKGILFTNGTGTGKTFSGLGIAKRSQLAGKGNILIVVPTDAKAEDWIGEGAYVELPITKIKGTKDAGKAAVVTTYANFYQNEALINRDFDIVIYDESHYLGQNAQGNRTVYFDAHIKAANLPSFALSRAKEEYLPSYPEAPERLEKPDYYKISEQDYKKAQEKYEKQLPAYEEKKAAWDQVVKDLKEKQHARALEIAESTKVVMLSASPFAYHKTLQYGDGTLFDIYETIEETPYEGGYNNPTGFAKMLTEHFGYRMLYNKASIPESGVDVSLLERQFYENMVEKGVFSGRMLEVDKDYSRDFILVNSELGNQINEGFSLFRSHDDEQFRKKYKDLIGRVSKKWNYLYVNQLLESIKAGQAIGRIKQHLALGRKVVVFHGYNNALPAHPFQFNVNELLSPSEAADYYIRKNVVEQIDLFQSEYPELVNLDLGELVNPREEIMKVFGERAREFNGTVNKNKRFLSIAEFNDSQSGVDVFIVQRKAGKEGISLHDTDGEMPRVLMDLGLPIAPTDAIQTEGRTYRLGVKSNAMFEYMVAYTDFERFAYADKVASRAKTAENLAMGNKARNLEQSFIEGYQNAHDAHPSEITGEGGKEFDGQVLETSEYDRAKTFYFARGKKTARNKSAEGKDYFATPEPIGYKMVEWLGLKADERALEPSAGHGAIARFFPGNTNNVFIEPSYQLSSQLGLNVKGEVKQQTFEDLYIGNKYDAIAMNPPFGSSGKTAMEHVEKAFGHLKQNGRLIAIIPNGPSMQKRLDKFLYGANEKNKQLNPEAILRAEYIMPSVMFERAGTKVGTKIVIIDRIFDSKEQRTDLNIGGASQYDYTYIEKIGELFDELEHATVPERVNQVDETPAEVQAEDIPVSNTETTPIPETTLFSYGQQKHSKTGEVLEMVFMNDRVDRDEYKRLKAIATDLGGYYSSYKNKASNIKAGFVLPSFDKVTEFLTKANEPDISFLFTSPSKTALNHIKQNKATPEQWKAMLLKNGAKQVELDWMGFDEFSQDKKSLNKQEVSDWMEANKVELDEVVKGELSRQIDELPDGYNVMDRGESLGEFRYSVADLKGVPVV